MILSWHVRCPVQFVNLCSKAEDTPEFQTCMKRNKRYEWRSVCPDVRYTCKIILQKVYRVYVLPNAYFTNSKKKKKKTTTTTKQNIKKINSIFELTYDSATSTDSGTNPISQACISSFSFGVTLDKVTKEASVIRGQLVIFTVRNSSCLTTASPSSPTLSLPWCPLFEAKSLVFSSNFAK